MRKLVRIALIGMGAATIMTSVVDIVGAYKLIEKSDEEMMGVTRRELVSTYVALGLGGVGMVVGGFLLKPKRRPPAL